MAKLTPKQEKMLKEVRRNAEEVLKLCDQAEQGRITAEDFEKRCTKLSFGPVASIFGPPA